MCVGPMKPKRPAAPTPDPAIEAEQKEQKEQATEEAKSRRDTALEESVSRVRGGRGRRSLITSSRGGMGFYNEYLK